MTPNFVALARVSSREQEREGFSLEVQESALRNHATRQGGTIVKFYRIAETASKREERKAFKEMLAYVQEHAQELAGVLFYKVDRAARNIFDYVEVERLESDYGVPVTYVAQPTESTPAGRMQRRILSNMATFYTEQQSVDVREGMARRVQSGFFVGKSPYGYRNVRRDGRSIIETHPEQAAVVRKMFELYAYHHHTIDSVGQALHDQEMHYSRSQPKFTRSKIHLVLRDRAYLGEVFYKGQWYPGGHEPLIDSSLFQRVQALLGAKVYQSNELTYAGGLVVCGHCGRAVTGEKVTKKAKGGERHYVYYRCSGYTAEGHPRTRVTEAHLDSHVLDLFAKLRIEDTRLRAWIVRVLKEKSKAGRVESEQERERLQRELTAARREADTLLSMRLMDEIDSETFKRKNGELQGRIARLQLAVDVSDKDDAENRDLALKAFELSQALAEKWVSADALTKRHLLQIVCLNSTLEGESLVFTVRKPFDLLANGTILKNGRGGGI